MQLPYFYFVENSPHNIISKLGRAHICIVCSKKIFFGIFCFFQAVSHFVCRKKYFILHLGLPYSSFLLRPELAFKSLQLNVEPANNAAQFHQKEKTQTVYSAA